MGTPTKLALFLTYIRSKEGMPYCWPTQENNYSGKGWKHAKYKDCYDCSGLVTDGIFWATGGKLDYRMSTNCIQLLRLCRRVPDTEVKAGDFAFYGADPHSTTHVMVALERQGDVVPVFGASGGNSDVTSPAIAKKKGARVRSRSTHLYRRDFLGFYCLEALHAD